MNEMLGMSGSQTGPEEGMRKVRREDDVDDETRGWREREDEERKL